MRRAVDLAEISDGRLYRSNDLVKLDTGGCAGCSACCHEMEETIVLGPYDMWRLQSKRALTLDRLLDGHASLALIDGLVLPVLTMNGPFESCSFLDGNGRCSIHDARPGICRLFPLGRIYEGGDFRYFLQTKECGRGRAKIRIRKWMDTPDLPRYEQFVVSWHSFLEGLDHILEREDEALRKAASIYLLQAFYRVTWKGDEDFYVQYEQRMDAARKHFGFLA